MKCTRCGQPIIKGQPYARTKNGPHHFKPEQCPVSVADYYRLFVVRWSESRHPEYTLGQMLEIARCLQDFDNR